MRTGSGVLQSGMTWRFTREANKAHFSHEPNSTCRSSEGPLRHAMLAQERIDRTNPLSQGETDRRELEMIKDLAEASDISPQLRPQPIGSDTMRAQDGSKPLQGAM